MRVSRQDPSLNERIEALDEKYIRAQSLSKTAAEVIPRTWEMLDADELAFIDGELDRCIIDRRYFMENYYVIRDERGRLKTLYPWWDHQELVYEAVEEEWQNKGCCRLIILKPRQAGSTTWNGALITSATIFVPNTFSLLMAQDGEVSGEIYQRVMDAFHALPFWMQPETMSKQQGTRVIFQRDDQQERVTDPGLGSTLMISNAQRSTGVAIGRTIKNILGCLTSNNFILDSRGLLLPISEARVGMKIIVPGGGVGTIKGVASRSARNVYPGAENGYRITSWCNPAFPLEGTGNHTVMCCRIEDQFKAEHRQHRADDVGHRRERKVITSRGLKEFQDITKDDFVVVPVTPITEDGEVPEGGMTPYRAHGGGSVNAWYPPAPSREFGFAVGLYLAEGCISNSVTIALDSDEQELADRFAEAVRIPYGKVTAGANGSRTRHYHFYNAAFRNWLTQHLGKKDEKHIPRWAWQLGREFLSGVVEGLILGDGHLDPKTHSISFCSIRAHLSLALREAVCSLGHGYGGINSPQESGFRYGRNCQKIWTVKFGRLTNNALRRAFGWECASRQSSRDVAHYLYSPDKTEVYVRVRSIERVPLETVYDIEMDTADRLYMLPGAITHNSEVSRWPDASVWTADIKPSLNAPDMLGIMESTAYGRNGLYYNMWRAAESGKSIWRALFIPVYRVRKYFIPVMKSDNFRLTPDERGLRENVLKTENFAIPLGFFKWRRAEIAETINSTGSDETHFESYPVTSQEAFINSGFCSFPRRELKRQLQVNACDPIAIGEIEYTGLDTPPMLHLHKPVAEELLDKPEKFNRLWIWEEPLPPSSSVEYYLSGDVGGGEEGNDYSALSVYRLGYASEPDIQVATWHGHMNPSHLARVVAALGQWYNGCEVAVEYAQSGITTCNELQWTLDYPNLYRWKQLDKIGNTATVHTHWMTTERTRSDAINRMNEKLLDHTIVIRNRHTLEEMLDFGTEDGGGKAQGLDNNDDMVMCDLINVGAASQSGKHRELAEAMGMGTGVASSTAAGLMPTGPCSYAVFDQYSRQVEQVDSEQAGLDLIARMEAKHKIKLNWRVVPVTVMKANTPWSDLHDGQGAARGLYEQGMKDTHITPDIVQLYRDMLNHERHQGGPAAVVDGEDY